jgi:hypothetical protein
MRSRCLTVVIALGALGACSDDEGDPRPQMDATVPDGSIDAATDARSDASGDAGLCALDQRYTFRWTGGNAPLAIDYELLSSGILRVAARSQTTQLDGGTADTETCTLQLACESSSKVDISELAAALTAPGVESSFSDAYRLFGDDNTPVDAQVFVIERGLGEKIHVGSPCSATSTDCTAIPPAVDALRTLLIKLTQEHARLDNADGGATGVCPLTP